MTTALQARDRWRRLAWALTVLLLLTAGCTEATRRTSAAPLITEEEAAMPPAPPETERGACGPPEIQVESPRDGGTYRSPLPIDVRFIPSSGSAIDPASARIELLKLGLKIDLTKRAQEFIKPGGITMPRAEIPGGTHRVRISVTDTSGKKCSETVEFTVSR